MDKRQAHEQCRAGEDEAEAATKGHREDQTDAGQNDHRLQRGVIGQKVGSQVAAIPQVGAKGGQFVPCHIVQVVALPPER
tara:strand:- start:128 stop:367 length:240 start_codon:yes stop_codon:yes gene_type:complete